MDSSRSTCLIACLVTRPRARAKPCPIVLTATEAVSMTPRVAARARHAALARDPPPGITNANLHSVMPSPPSEGCSGTRRVFQCLGSPRTMWKFQPPSWKDSPTRYATRRKIRKVELRKDRVPPRKKSLDFVGVKVNVLSPAGGQPRQLEQLFRFASPEESHHGEKTNYCKRET